MASFITIPKFSGGNSQHTDEYLEAIEAALCLVPIIDESKLNLLKLQFFKSNLTGDAERWCNGLDLGTRTNYDKLISAFKKRFEKKQLMADADVMTALWTFKRQNGESLASYLTRADAINDRLHDPELKKVLANQFVFNLKDGEAGTNIQMMMIMSLGGNQTLGRTPTLKDDVTYDEVRTTFVTMASCMPGFETPNGKPLSSMTENPDTAGEVVTMPMLARIFGESLRDAMRGLAPRQPLYDPARPPPARPNGGQRDGSEGPKCWNCGKPGHRQGDCPEPKQPREVYDKHRKEFYDSKGMTPPGAPMGRGPAVPTSRPVEGVRLLRRVDEAEPLSLDDRTELEQHRQLARMNSTPTDGGGSSCHMVRDMGPDVYKALMAKSQNQSILNSTWAECPSGIDTLVMAAEKRRAGDEPAGGAERAKKKPTTTEYDPAHIKFPGTSTGTTNPTRFPWTETTGESPEDFRPKPAAKPKGTGDGALKPIALSKRYNLPAFNVWDQLARKPIDITLGQLLSVSPHTRTQLVSLLRLQNDSTVGKKKGKHLDTAKLARQAELWSGGRTHSPVLAQLLDKERRMMMSAAATSEEEKRICRELDRNAKDKDSALAYIPAVIDHWPSNLVLLDCGASSTIITEACAYRLGIAGIELSQPHMVSLADDRVTAIKWCASFTLVVGDTVMSESALIFPGGATFDVIFGISSMRKSKCVLDWRSNKVHLQKPDESWSSVNMHSLEDIAQAKVPLPKLGQRLYPLQAADEEELEGIDNAPEDEDGDEELEELLNELMGTSALARSTLPPWERPARAVQVEEVEDDEAGK